MSAVKRKRVELKIEQKYEIIRYHEAHPQLKQHHLIVHFNTVFDTVIGKSTMSDILANKKKILRIDDIENDFNKRIRNAKYPELEECLYTWLKDKLDRKIPISDDMLIEKAKVFGQLLQITDFKYSNGWLNKFKDRFDISRQIILGESGDVCDEMVKEGLLKIKQAIRGYNKKDIFNLDETALFYRLPPNIYV
jgi:hypothetical protein